VYECTTCDLQNYATCAWNRTSYSRCNPVLYKNWTTWNNCSGVQLEYQVLYSSTVVPGKAKPCGPLKSLPRSARVACRGSWLRAIGVVGEMHTVPSVRCSKIDTHETYVDIVGFSPEYRVRSTVQVALLVYYQYLVQELVQLYSNKTLAFWHSFF
jgi:hypothetical protein